MIIKLLIVLGILLGATDILLDGKLGVKNQFMEAFNIMGSMAITMGGVMVLSPVFASLLKPVLLPICARIGIDPSVVSIIVGADTGGYQMAMALTENTGVAYMLGIVTAGMLGGSLTFNIPMALSIIEKKDTDAFLTGTLIGLSCIPVGSIIAGLMLGLDLKTVLINNIVVIILTCIIIFGLLFAHNGTVKVMREFAKIIKICGIAGICLGAMTFFTGWEIIPSMTPIMDAMLVVCQMTLTIAGLYPVMELLRRAFEKPFSKIGEKAGLDSTSISGLFIILVTSVPVFPLMKKMTDKGIMINAAVIAVAAGLFGSQLGLILGIDTAIVAPYLVGKACAAIVAFILVLLFSKKNSRK